jgi:hypothetical protein
MEGKATVYEFARHVVPHIAAWLSDRHAEALGIDL